MAASVTHAFVSPKGDGADATLVRPSNWNDGHVVANVLASDTEDQTFAGGVRITAKSLTTGNVTIDCGDRPLQYITNNGAFTITAPANDGSCILLITNGASAGPVTFTGFTVSATNYGDALTSTNGHMFAVSIWRINGISGFRIAAHQ